MSEEEPSLNIPSLLTLAVISFFVVRWFFSRGTSPDGLQGSGIGGAGGRRVDPAHVEQISQMFPQLSRRDIMWDLQRNGGSVAATTERVLTGRGLETAPPSYQPQIPTPAPVSPPMTSRVMATKAEKQDLISRYNLTSRVVSESEDTEKDDGLSTKSSPDSGWSQNRTERQRLLQKRRDEMILAARRKLQEKDRETAATSTGSHLGSVTQMQS